MSTYGSMTDATDEQSITDENEDNKGETVARSSAVIEHGRRQPLFSAEVCIVLYSFVYSVIATVQVQYVDYIERLDSDTSELTTCSNESSAEEYDIQRRVNFIVLGLVTASSGTSFFTVPILSQISIRKGYKLGLLINIVLLLISCCIWWISVSFQASYWWLAFAQVINGAGGAVAGVHALGTSYLSLLYDKYILTQRLAVSGAFTQLAIGIGQLIIGYIIDDYNFSASFVMAIIVAAVITVYTAVYIKDIRANDIGTTEPGMLRKVKLLVRENSRAANRKLLILCLVLCAHWSIMRACVIIAVIYVLSYPLCWGSDTIGYFLAILFGLAGIGPLLVFFGTIPDLYLCLLGIISSSLFLVCCIYGYSTEIMFIGASLALFRSIVGSALLAYLSKIYPHPRSKVVLAIAGCWIAIAEVLSPAVFQTIYGFTLQISSSIVFICMICVYIPCIVTVIIYADLIPVLSNSRCRDEVAILEDDEQTNDDALKPLLSKNS